MLLGVLICTFLLFEWLPGDPARLYAGPDATAEQVEAVRSRLGLAAPARQRLVRFVGGLVRGDLGHSFRSGDPVARELARRYPTTLRLAALSLLLTVALGVPAGVVAAARPRSLAGRLAAVLSALLPSFPFFWLGLLLMLALAVWWPLLPPGGGDGVVHLTLPALTLGLTGAGLLARYTRAAVGEVLGEPFIAVARAKGLAERTVLWRHALRPALIPVVTAAGLQAGHLLGGSVLVESIFALGGIGRYLVQSIGFRDFPAVQGTVLLLALSFCAVNLTVELLYGWLDPRIRTH